MNNKIIEHLCNYGVKPSLHRIAVMTYLMEHKTHPTVDMIYTDLNPSIPTLSKTTVYNTLKLLVDQGAVNSLNIDEKNVRYDGDIFRHSHFRCKSCGKIFDLPAGSIPALEPSLPSGFSLVETQVYYKGYCKDCIPEIPAS